MPLPELLKGHRQRTIWVRNWLSERREKGEYDLLVNKLRLEDAEGFRRYLRMNSISFARLFELVGPKITKQRTRLREPIPAEEKLAITLRFLATGESYGELQFHYRIHATTISRFSCVEIVNKRHSTVILFDKKTSIQTGILLWG